MSDYDKYLVAYDIALDLLESEGTEPEFMSMAEAVGEVGDDFDLFDVERLDLLTEVRRLVKGAEVKYKLPGEQ